MNKFSAYVSKVVNLKEDLLKILEFIGWREQVKKDSTVFIKPNFTFPYYKEGITTSPELLKNLLEIIKGRADSVILGESDGGNHSFTADNAFKGHNMYEISKEIGADLINLSKLPSVFISGKIQGKNVNVQLPKLLLEEVDCFISVPVLKVHVMTGVTLSIKNLWGCYPNTMRCLHHKHLSHKLALIAKLINPKIAIIDGIYALDNHGPMYGKAKKTDILISSNNTVVADSLGATIMGIDPKHIHHILIAEKEGLGTTNLQQVKINNGWDQFRMQFHILNKTLIDKISIQTYRSEYLSKIVMDSPFTPLFYKVAGLLRTPEEKNLANQMRRYY